MHVLLPPEQDGVDDHKSAYSTLLCLHYKTTEICLPLAESYKHAENIWATVNTVKSHVIKISEIQKECKQMGYSWPKPERESYSPNARFQQQNIQELKTKPHKIQKLLL